jgi:hypothetical protein
LASDEDEDELLEILFCTNKHNGKVIKYDALDKIRYSGVDYTPGPLNKRYRED